MPPPTLRDRLERLRQPARPDTTGAQVDPSAASDGLRSLEHALLGDSGEGLPLKLRLERLVNVAAARERTRRTTVATLDDLVDGRCVENERGRFFLIENERSLDHAHGSLPLARLTTVAPQTLTILAGEAELDGFELSRSVFLDTETTGLAGGTGTAAFLVGIGFVRDGRFVVRQYFMRDYDEEGALLHALAEDLSGFSEVVTFNGKMFDLPLLEARFRLNRTRFPLAAATHLDLLHPARRLWKARLASCRLVHLESELLGIQREGDIPGEQIPQVYFDFIRGGDARLLTRVFEHNRLDIVSLAALTALACQWLEEDQAEDPRDVLSVARIFERAADGERSQAEYLRALASSRPGIDDAVRRAALARLANHARGTGDIHAAREYLDQAAAAGSVDALRDLAVLHEHQRRDPHAALAAVERAITLLQEELAPRGRLLQDLHHRRERLRRRLARATPPERA